MKRNGPAWFKFEPDKLRSLISTGSDESISFGVKCAISYFYGEPIPTDEMTEGAAMIYATLRDMIDVSFEVYNASVEYGRAGGKKKNNVAGDPAGEPAEEK